MVDLNTRKVDGDTSFNSWEWQSEHVERKLKQGEYVSAETTLVAAGPPRFKDVSFGDPAAAATATEGNTPPSGGIYPIGLIENFGISQNKQLQRLFEIGAKRSYFIPGRTISSLNMGRVLFWGPSLMRVMYAYYPGSNITMADGQKLDQRDGIELQSKSSGSPEVIVSPGTISGGSGDEKRKAAFFINLASDLFNQPLGLLCYMKDARNQVYGAFYLEDVFIQAHQFNLNASSVLVAEGVSAQFDTVHPVNVA